MQHKLARIFGELGDRAAAEIERVEARLGFPSEDVRLLADSHQQVRAKLVELGLDPDDTRPKELYQALHSRYQQDCAEFEKRLDVANLSPAEKINGSLAVASLLLQDQPVWALKRRSAKALIKSLPPVRTKKLLGFRTYDSMLKRTDASLVLLSARRIESASWQTRFERAVAKTNSHDWEVRPIKLLQLPDSAGGNGMVLADKAAGAAAINYQDQPVLTTVVQLLQAAATLTGKDTTNKLTDFSARVKWWLDNAHLVAWLDGEPVSLNLLDVAVSHHAGSFADRSFEHAANQLWRNLVSRYKNLTQELAAATDIKADLSAAKKLAPELVAIEEINE